VGPLVSEVVRRQHSLEDLLHRLLGMKAENIVRDVVVLDQTPSAFSSPAAFRMSS